MNFRIMYDSSPKQSFGRSTAKRIEENSNEAYCYYLYSIVNKCFKDEYRHGEMIGTN